MASSVLSKFTQVEISPQKAAIAAVAVTAALALGWYWFLSKPRYTIPPYEQLKAAQQQILKSRAEMSLAIHEDTMLDSTGKAKPKAAH